KEVLALLAKERQEYIMKKIRRDKSIKAMELIKHFQVSFETIRRDLLHLENQGLLTRVHGGAILEEVNSRELPFTVRESKYLKEKEEIADKATEYVIEGQSIAMDVSTTNTEFAKALKRKFSRLTILTNSMIIAHQLAAMPHYTIIFAGGIVRNQQPCTVIDCTKKFITLSHVDTLSKSITKISQTTQLTDYGAGERQGRKKLMEIVQHRMVPADNSKFDGVSLLNVCSIYDGNRI